MKPTLRNDFAIDEFLREDFKGKITDLLFRDIKGGYINEFYLFARFHNAIPNLLEERQMNCHEANAWFKKTYEEETQAFYFSQLYYSYVSRTDYDDTYYVLHSQVALVFDMFNSTIRILMSEESAPLVEEIRAGLQQYKKKKKRKKPVIFLLVQKHGDLDTETVEMKKPKLKISDNYNDDFAQIHLIIYKRLSKQHDKGLVLLHGKPGTGKTSYIRYLAASLRKRVIFLPPNIAEVITNPAFMTLLIERPNTVLVIEDAETIIMDRQHGGRSSVSALLNLADGLLSDCLNIQIICSFNTDISRIDNALLRRGRLIAQYEFKALETQKAQALSDKLGYTSIIKQPTNLADIYNQEEKEFLQKKREGIGFVNRANAAVV